MGKIPVLTCQVQRENGICGKEMLYARNKNRTICRECERERRKTTTRNLMRKQSKYLVEKNEQTS
jgi:hypothetical protein